MNTVVSEHSEERLSLGKYIFGFLGSIALTLTAYLLVTHHATNKDVLVGVLAGLAIIQFIVQMVFFLHLGDERRPRWKLMVAVFMLGVVLIVVFGSLWIMNNLNYRMTPQQVQQYLKSQDSL
jgi:cytochrome o ubiquinol oxidase operon protein cyoD